MAAGGGLGTGPDNPSAGAGLARAARTSGARRGAPFTALNERGRGSAAEEVGLECEVGEAHAVAVGIAEVEGVLGAVVHDHSSLRQAFGDGAEVVRGQHEQVAEPSKAPVPRRRRSSMSTTSPARSHTARRPEGPWSRRSSGRPRRPL